MSLTRRFFQWLFPKPSATDIARTPTEVLSRMHARLMTEVELQQRANRRKRITLRGLRAERQKLRDLIATLEHSRQISKPGHADTFVDTKRVRTAMDAARGKRTSNTHL